VLPVSKVYLLLHGIWSYLCIKRAPCYPTLGFLFAFWILIIFDKLFTSLFCIDWEFTHFRRNKKRKERKKTKWYKIEYPWCDTGERVNWKLKPSIEDNVWCCNSDNVIPSLEERDCILLGNPIHHMLIPNSAVYATCNQSRNRRCDVKIIDFCGLQCKRKEFLVMAASIGGDINVFRWVVVLIYAVYNSNSMTN
jgi:hypothetical protein